MMWRLYQESRISAANQNASRAESKVTSAEEQIRLLEDKVDSLALTCQALWEIVRDNSKLSEEDLVKKVSEVDLRDGSADGKMGSQGNPCAKCGRTLSKRRARCMYCGAFVEKDHIFQK